MRENKKQIFSILENGNLHYNFSIDTFSSSICCTKKNLFIMYGGDRNKNYELYFIPV